jgi:hypothetical protein
MPEIYLAFVKLTADGRYGFRQSAGQTQTHCFATLYTTTHILSIILKRRPIARHRVQIS